MTEPKAPSSASLATGTSSPTPSGGGGWVKQVQSGAEPALAYPPPPGSTQGSSPTQAVVPTPASPTSMNYPALPTSPAGHAQPQVVHNTVVQNHYHSGGAQLVRTSSRDRSVAALLAFFLGAFGVHRYYLGRPGSATVMLVLSLTGVFFPIVAVWALVDMIAILTTSKERFELRYNCSIAPGALPPGNY